MDIEGKRLAPSRETKEEVRAAVAEVGVYSTLMQGIDSVLKNHERWGKESPSVVIHELLASAPGPRVYKRSEMPPAAELRNSQPASELESYFLFKLIQSDPKAFQLSAAEAKGESFLPAESIKCLRDGIRTKKFVAAIERSVHDLEQESSKIRVLDAGAGAIPILGIAAALASVKVDATCLEMNPHSAQMARAVVAALGLSDRIAVIEADATTYVPPQSVDILVSETMNTGLIDEPLTDILNHLASYVGKGGRIIPERVETYAASVPLAAYEGSDELVHIYDNPAPKVKADWQKTGIYVPGVPMPSLEADLPGSAKEGEKRVALIASRVHLGSETLNPYESLITMPQAVGSHTEEGGAIPHTYATAPGGSLHISYAPGIDPRDIRITEK